ncbi:hypothetical protein VTP01DRAFT_102 [Rhizomucor pusillus]|uniref:uncharacterized protein n=1 Tax=Rhizomucor pusillus TaxID=4840 RepID=UPI003742F059
MNRIIRLTPTLLRARRIHATRFQPRSNPLPLLRRPLTCTAHLLAKTPKVEDDLEEIDPKEYPELYPEEPVDTEWFVEQDEKDFVPLWQRRALGDQLKERWALSKVSQKLMESGALSPETLRDLLVESKMDNVQVLDVRDRCDWTDYMIIADSDNGERFLHNVADQVGQVVRKAIREHNEDLPLPHVEGRDSDSGWLLIDLGRCVVHLFTPQMRQLYDLEGLWTKDFILEEEEQKNKSA